jgi:phenylacetate-CoA ligase
MRASTFISCLYGEMRGYERLRIRLRATAHQRLSPGELERLTEHLFQKRVQDAINRFPAYAEKVLRHRGSLPGKEEVVRPEELPVWTRHDQRALFAAQPRPFEPTYVHETSGSTTLPVSFYVTRRSYEWRCAVSDRGYSWAGAEEGNRVFFLWAAEPRKRRLSHRIKRFVHQRLQCRMVFDVYRRIGEEELERCCRLIERYRPHAIVGYTAMLVELGRFVRDHPGSLRWRPRSMVCAAECLQPGQRDLLEEHVVDEVFVSYGSREFMGLAMECSRHSGYHAYADNTLLEIVDADGRPVPPGRQGRVLVTDLNNHATPFVRYEIGDFGTMAPSTGAGACPCGLPFPLITSIDGRLQDVVYAADGRSVTGLYLAQVFGEFPWIEGYQMVQDEPGRIRVRLVTREELMPERVAPVTERMREQLGHDMHVEYERAQSLVRRPSGKVRIVMSSLKGD